MKTTLDINEGLFAAAQVPVTGHGASATGLVEEGSQTQLRAHETPAHGTLRLPVFKGQGGLVAGVDLLSNKALLHALGENS